MTDRNVNRQQQNLVKGIVLLSGIVFMFAGASGLLMPSLFDFMFGDDVFLSRVLGGALFIAGISDLIVAKIILFKGSDRV